LRLSKIISFARENNFSELQFIFRGLIIMTLCGITLWYLRGKKKLFFFPLRGIHWEELKCFPPMFIRVTLYFIQRQMHATTSNSKAAWKQFVEFRPWRLTQNVWLRCSLFPVSRLSSPHPWLWRGQCPTTSVRTSSGPSTLRSSPT
jgi:hypothetical protein